MRKVIVLAILSMLVSCRRQHQNAVLHITLENNRLSRCHVYIQSQPKGGIFNIPLIGNRTVDYTFKLTKPEFAKVSFVGANGKELHYTLYLSPGDDLDFNADLNQTASDIKVTGRGSENNQPLLSAMENINLNNFYGDTLPYRAIIAIKKAQLNQEDSLVKYVALYHPSQSFTNTWKINLRYYTSDLYNNFKGSNNMLFAIREVNRRNNSKWQKITDSLYRIAKLDNDTALVAFHYTNLVSTFLYRQREHLWDEEQINPQEFYREWYNTSDTAAGRKQFYSDPKNRLGEMIINKYFTGKTAEYLYAVLLSRASMESNPKNVPEIFGRFKTSYPHSKYIAQFTGFVDTTIAKQKHILNKNMVFMPQNGTNLNTMKEVLATMKGKTVLVDMWGTWCGPCREEIEKHSAAIREHFKGKGLTYLYIANSDLHNQEQWKKLIAYFGMEGIHLLASRNLTEDVMTRLKQTGYPTEFIIKKDGTYELSQSGYPIKRDILFKQLEKDLAM